MTVDAMWPAGLLPTGDEAQKVGRCSCLGALPAWLGLVLVGIAAWGTIVRGNRAFGCHSPHIYLEIYLGPESRTRPFRPSLPSATLPCMPGSSSGARGRRLRAARDLPD